MGTKRGTLLARIRGSQLNRLSVIVPTLNEAENIRAALQVLASARKRGVEIIVVDGGSADATVAGAELLADRVVCTTQGRAVQLNAGAAVASGDVLLFLHADTRAPEDVDFIIDNAVGGRSLAWGRFDVRIESPRRALRMVAAMMNLRSRLSGIATGDQGIFVTRALFDRIGGFRALPLLEDIALSRDLKRITAPECLRARVLTSARRWERRGVVRTILLMWRIRLAYYFGVDPADLAPRYEHVR